MKKRIVALCLALCFIASACAALAEPMVLKDPDGAVLEQGASLSGRYYYKVYVEGVPEDCEAIQTGWVHDATATEPVDWETNPRHLHTDEKGKFFYVVPIVGADYVEETMFARRDENDPDIVRLVFYYDRDTIIEVEPPVFTNENDPQLGEHDYVLTWSEVEGAEFYSLLWQKPSGKLYYYMFFSNGVNLDVMDDDPSGEVGEYYMEVIPYGDGFQMTTSDWWAYEITE